MPIPTPKGDRTVNKKILLGMIACVLLLTVGLLTACDGGKTPADTTAEDTPTSTDAPTEEPTPEATEPTDTEAPTQPEETTEEVTTEETTEAKEEIYHPTLEEVGQYATTILATEDILKAAHNEQQDWSDFGGLTLNEDGSLTALFRYGSDNVSLLGSMAMMVKSQFFHRHLLSDNSLYSLLHSESQRLPSPTTPWYEPYLRCPT